MRLLLTGFEPFGGSAINPSALAVQALQDSPPAQIELITAVLPVDWQRGPQALLEALQSAQPQAVVCLGEAAGRTTISIERVAVNLLDFRIPDNAGEQITDQPIRAGAPAAYFSSLPVRRMLAAVQESGVPGSLSLSAGSYLCNQVMYTLLDELARLDWRIPAGFIHLPRLPEQTAHDAAPGPSMSLDSMLKGLRAALAVLRSETGG
jgi:pyroglutamyl-peptidase